MADFRKRVHELYGIDPSSYLLTWVYDNKLVTIFNNQQTVKEIKDQNKGVLLLFEIPAELNPKMPPITQIKKDDSNYGIDPEWCKVVIHIYKDQSLMNLARFIWVKKSWTLKELHLRFFDEFKDLIYRWYKDWKDLGKTERHSVQQPPFKHPDSGELLTYDTLLALPLEKQF